MSTNKTKKITKTKTPIKNTTRKLPVFHHLTKTSRSRILGMQTYKLNCSKNLMIGYKTIKSSEETSMDKDDFVHVVLSKLKDCDKPVIVKVYDETNVHLKIEKEILKVINGYRNTVKLICDFTCNDDKNNYFTKINKRILFCGNGGPDLLHFFVYEYIQYGDISYFFMKIKDIRIIKSFILQITCVIIQLVSIFKINHGDINSGNILIDTINEKTIDYKIEDETFTIETFGVMPKIIDYGRSKIYKKDYSIDDIWHDIIMVLGIIHLYIENAELKNNILNILNSFNRHFSSEKDCYIYIRDNL